ncbi:hypothetical protein EV122DRAFT_289449 [Schizophyllum commune]
MRHCDDAILTGVDRCTLLTNGSVLDYRNSPLSRHLAFAKRQTIVRFGNEADNGLSSRAAAHGHSTAIIALQIIDGDFLRDYWP